MSIILLNLQLKMAERRLGDKVWIFAMTGWADGLRASWPLTPAWLCSNPCDVGLCAKPLQCLLMSFSKCGIKCIPDLPLTRHLLLQPYFVSVVIVPVHDYLWGDITTGLICPIASFACPTFQKVCLKKTCSFGKKITLCDVTKGTYLS